MRASGASLRTPAAGFLHARSHCTDSKLLRAGRRTPGTNSIHQVKFFSRLKTDRSSRCNRHFCPGSGISANSSFSRAHTKNAETAQFDPVSCRQCVFHALKHGIDSGFRFHSRQPRPVCNFVYNVLFDQSNLSVPDSKFRTSSIHHARFQFSRLSIRSPLSYTRPKVSLAVLCQHSNNFAFNWGDGCRSRVIVGSAKMRSKTK